MKYKIRDTKVKVWRDDVVCTQNGCFTYTDGSDANFKQFIVSREVTIGGTKCYIGNKITVKFKTHMPTEYNIMTGILVEEDNQLMLLQEKFGRSLNTAVSCRVVNNRYHIK